MPNIPGTVSLTATLLEGNSRQAIPGAPILEVVSDNGGGGSGGGKNSKNKDNTKDNKGKNSKAGARLQLDPNGTVLLWIHLVLSHTNIWFVYILYIILHSCIHI